MSLMKTTRTSSGAAAEIGARAMDAAAQALPAGKRAGTIAVQGVVQGVQGAKEWAAPRLEDAADAVTATVVQGVLDAREWAAPRLEDAADAVTDTVAPKVSSALRSTAQQVRPVKPGPSGIRRLLDWRWLLGLGAVAAAAGATTAITWRRYATATAAANDATESSDRDRPADGADQAGDAAQHSDANGRVSSTGR